MVVVEIIFGVVVSTAAMFLLVRCGSLERRVDMLEAEMAHLTPGWSARLGDLPQDDVGVVELTSATPADDWAAEMRAKGLKVDESMLEEQRRLWQEFLQ